MREELANCSAVLKLHWSWSILSCKMVAKYPDFCLPSILRLATWGDDVNCIRSIATLLHGSPNHMEGSKLAWYLASQFISHTGTKSWNCHSFVGRQLQTFTQVVFVQLANAWVPDSLTMKISETQIWACFTKIANHTVLFTHAGVNYPMISWGNTKTVALCACITHVQNHTGDCFSLQERWLFWEWSPKLLVVLIPPSKWVTLYSV